MGGAPTDETVSRAQRAGDPGDAPDARLRVVHPVDLACTIPLSTARTVLGRNPPAPLGVWLRHATVSRQHLAIEWDAAAGHVAVDLQSRNGSWIDGRAASTRLRLQDGSVARLGDVLCVYERGPGLAIADPADVSLDAIPGAAPEVRLLRDRIARAARDPSPVVVTGETGTGKEYVARELHRLSGRAGPFVAVNCAALSPQLVESQLFGHDKGAFTGATSAQPGLFRAADGGTLFLDEIGELPVDLQPKLLRALEEGEVTPVGLTRAVPVDVRVIAATNRPLADEVDAGRFRRDLYARLGLWRLELPSLRQRRGDLLLWIDRLRRAWLADRPHVASTPLELDADAAEALLLHDWPDNLRGVARLVHDLSAVTGAVTRRELPAWVLRREPRTDGEPPAPAPIRPTRDELVAALERHGWSIRATAKHLGCERRQVYRWMEKLGIRRDGSEER